MRYHIVKKHSGRTAKTVLICKKRDKDFHSSFIIGEHKGREHGAQRGSRVQNDDRPSVMGCVQDKNFKEDLQTCKHFLVESEMEKGRVRIFNFPIDTLNPKFRLKKMHTVLKASNVQQS